MGFPAVVVSLEPDAGLNQEIAKLDRQFSVNIFS